MKKNSLLFLLLVSVFSLQAQVTDVITGLSNPISLYFDGTDMMYYAETSAGTVSRFNTMESDPVPEELLSGINFPSSIIVDEDLLYVADNGVGVHDILVGNLMDEPLMMTNVITNTVSPTSILLNEDYMYIVSYLLNKIARLDLNAPTPVVEDVVIDLGGPSEAFFDGNDLYIIEFTGDKISKIDITDSNPMPIDVVTGLDGPNHALKIGDDLYISEFHGDKISKFNLTTEVIEDFITDINGPSDIAIAHNGSGFLEFYICESVAGKISKFTSELVAVNEPLDKKSLTVFPNPSQDFIIINNLSTVHNAAILTVDGRLVKVLKIEAGKQIDIRDLPTGAYLLKIDDGQHLTFVKG